MKNFNDKENGVFNMLQIARPTSQKVKLDNFNLSASNFVIRNTETDFFKIGVNIYDAENLNLLAINDRSLRFNNIETEEALEDRDIFYLEKHKQEKNPDLNIQFAEKTAREIAHTLSENCLQIYNSHESIVNGEGYCIVQPSVRIPLVKNSNGKVGAVATMIFDATKFEYTESLYRRYQDVYKNDIKKGNRLFMEYLGLPVNKDFVLTAREIEVLISFAKHRTNVNVSRDLGLAEGTVAAYISNIKSRLHNQNFNDILLYFTTTDRRKF